MPLTRRIVALSLLTALALGSLATQVRAFQRATHSHPGWHPREDVVLIIPQRRLPRRAPNAAFLEAVDATIDIKNQLATTILKLSLTNPTDAPQEVELLMPIPEGVIVRSLQYDGAVAASRVRLRAAAEP